MAESRPAKYCTQVVSKIAQYLCADEFCDVDVVVGEQVYKCHRVVLSAASVYFFAMFNGNFREGSATEVTLHDIEADVFEKVLEFIYSGDVDIPVSKIYDLIRAADFYKLPLLMDHCTEFVEEELNALAEDVLKMLAFAHNLGLKQLGELLSGHVHKNFGYFSEKDEFSKLTFESVARILDTKPANGPLMQDALVEGVYSWIRRQTELTAKRRTLYFERLFDKIDSTRISIEYSRYRMRRYGNELARDNSNGGADDTDDVRWPVNLLYAYVSRLSASESPIGTSIFTAYSRENISSSSSSDSHPLWVYSGEVAEFTAHFMRNVHIDGCLYSLRYLNVADADDHYETFRCASSISMYPYLTLTPPPCILRKFDLCGARNNIYACSKYIPPLLNEYSEVSEFSQEELSMGLFVYKRDLDKWFPMPRPKKRFVNACMTCDEEEMVYLIGGRQSRGYVQAYDPRLPEWFRLPYTTGDYVHGACCAYGKRIFVAGGTDSSTMVEMFDAITGNWYFVKDLSLDEPRLFDHHLVNWYSQIEGVHRILSFQQPPFAAFEISYLNPSAVNSEWCFMPSSDLFRAASNANLNFFDLSLLDMINF